MPTQTPEVLAAVWNSAYVDSLPDSSFAYVNGDTRKLPYKTAAGKVDLPHVRDALSRLSATQGISDSDKASIKTKLQSALKNAKAADDMTLTTITRIQADDTTKELPSRMMLLRSGVFETQKYGEIPLEADDLREMDTNFKAGIGMAGDGTTGIPVDYSHESHKNAGAWIKGMAVEESAEYPGEVELWATDIEFSDSGKQAILGKEYKCLSSDFYPKAFGEWVDPESGVSAKNVIVGAAFTNRPMFSGNQPVTASEVDDNVNVEGGTKTVIYINATQKKEQTMELDTLRIKAADDLTGPEQRFLQANVAELSADERKKFELVEPVAADDEDKDGKKPAVVTAAEVKGDEGQVLVQATELKTLVDEVGALKANYSARDKDVIREEVKKHAARGAIKSDRIESWTDRIAASDEKGRNELWTDLKGIADNPLLAKEQGSGDDDENVGSDPRSELMNKAVKMAAESQDTDHPLSIEQAVDKVKAAEPDLAARAIGQRKEQLTSVEASEEQFTTAGINRG